MKIQDRKVKEQAIKREYDRAARQKREPKFIQGYGHLVVGSIFDCNRNSFERALRAYWDKLYVGWNPYKKEGRGCWEVWQKPSKQVAKIAYEGEDFHILMLEEEPSDYEHWVADLDYLSYDFIQKLREMDSWENKQLVANHDDAYEAYFDKLEQEEEDNIKYVVRHNKQAFRDLLEYTKSGFNPLDFFRRK